MRQNGSCGGRHGIAAASAGTPGLPLLDWTCSCCAAAWAMHCLFVAWRSAIAQRRPLCPPQPTPAQPRGSQTLIWAQCSADFVCTFHAASMSSEPSAAQQWPAAHARAAGLQQAGRACVKMEAGDRRPDGGPGPDVTGRPSSPSLPRRSPSALPFSAAMRSGRPCCASFSLPADMMWAVASLPLPPCNTSLHGASQARVFHSSGLTALQRACKASGLSSGRAPPGSMADVAVLLPGCSSCMAWEVSSLPVQMRLL